MGDARASCQAGFANRFACNSVIYQANFPRLFPNHFQISDGKIKTTPNRGALDFIVF